MSAKAVDLDVLEAKAKAATPSPWEWRTNEARELMGDDDLVVIGVAQAGERRLLVDDEDAAFIAAASPDVVLALISELREARAEIKYRDELAMERAR